MCTQKNIYSLFLLICVVLVSSCNTYNQTESITATMTATSTRTNQSLSPTNTQVDTPTPLPTLGPTQSAITIYSLLSSDEFCRLPCFGGVTPGITSWQDARAFFETFSEIYIPPAPPTPHTYAAMMTDPRGAENDDIGIIFYTNEEDVVTYIKAFRYDYSIQRLLRDYGQPDEIYLFILDILPYQSSGTFELILFYGSQGILAGYEGVTGTGEILDICPDNLETGREGPFLGLWSPLNKRSFTQVALKLRLFGGTFADLKHYHPLSQIAKMDVSTFYNIYSDPENVGECFSIKNPHIRE